MINRPSRTTYQALAWLEKFSTEETERDQCRAALNELDQLRTIVHDCPSCYGVPRPGTCCDNCGRMGA